jgi:membrane protein YqaA with SNARE-associated domain
LPFIGDPLAISLGFFRTNLLKVSVWMFFGKLVKYILWAILTIWGISIF